MPAATARWTHAGSNTAANTAQQTHCSKRTAANTPQQTHRSKHTAANTPQQSAGCACCVQHRSCACHGKQHSLGHPASPPVIITCKQTPRDTRRVLWRSSAVAPHCMQAPQCMQSYVAIRVPAFLTPYEYNIQSCLAGRHASAAAAATCPHLRARASAARGDAPLVDLAMPKVAAPRDGAAMGAPAWAAAHRGGGRYYNRNLLVPFRVGLGPTETQQTCTETQRTCTETPRRPVHDPQQNLLQLAP